MFLDGYYERGRKILFIFYSKLKENEVAELSTKN
jgi:hypothetical protein